MAVQGEKVDIGSEGSVGSATATAARQSMVNQATPTCPFGLADFKRELESLIFLIGSFAAT